MQNQFYRNRKLYILLIWLMIAVSSTAVANKANIVNFHRADYRAANKNWSIAQDNDGVMYFGNDNGLLEFDGIRWRLYKPPHDKLVRSVAVSPDGLIFTGGYEEFGFWKRDFSGELIYQSLCGDFKDSFHNGEIWKIWTDDSFIFFQSFTSIYIYDRQNVRKIAPGNNILFLLKVRDEYWLQAMGGALYRMSKYGNFEEIDGSDAFANTEIRVILPFREKDYLIGTSTQGIFIYDGLQFKLWEVDFSQRVIPFELNNGILGQNGNYYFGTILSGLFEVSSLGDIVNHWSADNSMQNSTVLSLYKDKSGNIWAALDCGISYIQYLPDIDCYFDPQSKIGAIYSAALYNGMFYIGTNQGVFQTSLDKLRNPDLFTDLKLMEGTQGQVWFLEEVDNQLFFGHNKGLRVIGKDNVVKIVEGISTGVYKIKKINYSGNDYLFVGTYINARIMKYDNGSWNFLRNADLSGLQEPVTNFERDHLGNIWIEHARKGVYRCVFSEDMMQLKSVQFYSSNGRERLRLFKIGERVIFSANDSIFVYDDNTDTVVFHEGLNRFFKDIKELKNITPVSANRFLAVTTNNLYHVRFEGQNFEVEYGYQLENKNFTLVNNYENVVRLNDTLNLVCLDKGFLLHTATRTLRSDTLPDPRLRSVSAIDFWGNKKYLDPAQTNTYHLNFRKNTILFDFFTSDAFSDNLFFQYKLDGVNMEWTDPARIHEVLFERLSPGTYTFRLRTSDHLNNCSKPVTFSFNVSKPWYQLPMAYLIYALLFIVLAIIVWNFWLNQHLLRVRLREEQRLQFLNEELRKEISDKNSELLTQTAFIIQKNEIIAKVKQEISGFYHNLSGNKAFKPLYNKIKTLLDKNMDRDEDWKIFLIQFEIKHVDFFNRIKTDYPDLTPHDLKLCTCLKLNLSSKEIASLMNISLRGVENSRYRMRKKLRLTPNQNLTEFFLKY